MYDIKESDVIYRCIGENLVDGIVACGFMKKETAERSQYDFSNEFYSCFVLLKGSGDYISENGEVMHITAGDLVQRMPGVIHSTRVEPDGEWLEFFLSVGRDFFMTEERMGVLFRKPVIKDAVPKADVEHFKSLISSLKTVSQKELPVMALKLQQEILYLFGYGSTDKEIPGTSGLLQDACDILSQNLNREISMEELAGSVELGYETFRKEFRKEYGISPSHYRIKKRMEQACLLLESGIPIKEIARMVGYEDVYSFSKQFKKFSGIAPGKYRNSRFRKE